VPSAAWRRGRNRRISSAPCRGSHSVQGRRRLRPRDGSGFTRRRIRVLHARCGGGIELVWNTGPRSGRHRPWLPVRDAAVTLALERGEKRRGHPRPGRKTFGPRMVSAGEGRRSGIGYRRLAPCVEQTTRVVLRRGEPIDEDRVRMRSQIRERRRSLLGTGNESIAWLFAPFAERGARGAAVRHADEQCRHREAGQQPSR
jgi:hypothetical protein